MSSRQFYSFRLVSSAPTYSFRCVGVWDTVGSIGGVSPIIDALNIQDTSLPATVDVALHALSLQENRKKLLPTLWTPPQLGFRNGQSLTQVCHPMYL